MYLCITSCFFQAEDGIRGGRVTGVQTCALPILDQDRHARDGQPVPCAAAGWPGQEGWQVLVGPGGCACQVVGGGQVAPGEDAGRADAGVAQVAGLGGPESVVVLQAGGLGVQQVVLGDELGQQEGGHRRQRGGSPAAGGGEPGDAVGGGDGRQGDGREQVAGRGLGV